jgi:hypothetical protein
LRETLGEPGVSLTGKRTRWPLVVSYERYDDLRTRDG